jgi:hypothetical protein
VEKANGSFCVSPTKHDRALMLGKSILSQHLAFEGLIDEVRIYNRVLTPDEIEYLYQNP